MANAWADNLWNSHLKLPDEILANNTRYSQQCHEKEERDLPTTSEWSIPEYDVSCQLRSPTPQTKEVIFVNTTFIKLDWAVTTQSPDCTFSHFRVTYQIRESAWETVDAGFRPHYRLGDGLAGTGQLQDPVGDVYVYNDTEWAWNETV